MPEKILIPHWRCSECGVQYRTEKEAIDCEQTHNKPFVLLKTVGFVAGWLNKPEPEIRQIPDIVIVSISGEKYRYKFFDWTVK